MQIATQRLAARGLVAICAVFLLACAPAALKPSNESVTGRLIRYGNDGDSWLGVRDDAGQVHRLLFTRVPLLHDQAALLQTKTVRVLGSRQRIATAIDSVIEVDSLEVLP